MEKDGCMTTTKKVYNISPPFELVVKGSFTHTMEQQVLDTNAGKQLS
jgi:hypothetical protein